MSKVTQQEIVEALRGPIGAVGNAKRKELADRIEQHAISARRTELVDQFNATTDMAERATICRKLDATFDRRVDWHRRHSASYAYAKKYGLIQAKRRGGAHRQDLQEPVMPVISQLAKAREAIHRHAHAKKLDIFAEIELFERLRFKVKNGAQVKDVLAELTA